MAIRDRRKSGWFWVENSVLDEHGSSLGPFGLAVYFTLARLANNETQSTFPSQRRIARLIRVSERKVRDALNLLAKLQLIEITSRESVNGDRDTNEYTLLSLNKSESDADVSKISQLNAVEARRIESLNAEAARFLQQKRSA